MDFPKQKYMIPVHESWNAHERGNCTFIVHSKFCGWNSIIPKLQELMEDRMLAYEQCDEPLQQCDDTAETFK